MTVAYYGRRVTGPEVDRGEVAAGNMRGCVYNKVGSKNLWCYEVAGWVGERNPGGTAPTVRYGVYDAEPNVEPDTRVGYTNQGTAGVDYTDITGGSEIRLVVAVADNGFSNKAIRLYSGRHYAISVLVTPSTDTISHSMRASASITADNEDFYQRTGLSQPPPTSWGTLSIIGPGHQGHMSLWCVCDENEPPVSVVNRYPSGTIEESAPVFAGDFRDRNGAWGPGNGGADRGDQLNQYKIQLRQVGLTALKWDATFNSASSEKTNNRFSRAYGGSALTRGVAYEWRTMVSDQFGEWNTVWSDWLAFTPSGVGTVTLDGSPVDKIEDDTPDFQGRWTHQAATSMKRVQVRLLNINNTVLQTGADYDIADVNSSAAPGTLFTVLWANAGLSAIPWGVTRRYQIRGYDGTVWSDWSNTREFRTNAAPTVPSGLTPAGGKVFTSFMQLSALWSDPDVDEVGLTGTFEITRPDLTIVSVTPTLSTGRWRKTLTAAELNQFGLYSWRARSFDGTLYSGETTVAGSATWSAPVTFNYVTGPTVSITSPADEAIIATASLPVTWSPSAQAQYRVILYADGTTTIVFDTGWVVDAAARAYTIPAGSFLNGTPYDLAVGVKDGLGVEGWSVIDISISYPPANALLNIQAAPFKVGADLFYSGIRVTWDPTAYGDEFLGYQVKRWAESGPDFSVVTFDRITGRSITAFEDYLPASKHVYHYSVAQVIQMGADELLSSEIETSGSVTIEGTVLCVVGAPGTLRSVLQARERSHGRTLEEVSYQSLARKSPTTIRAAAVRTPTKELEAALYTDEAYTADQRATQLEEMDANGGTMCYRDGRGRKEFVKLEDLTIDDQLPDWYTASLSLRGEYFVEGVTK